MTEGALRKDRHAGEQIWREQLQSRPIENERGVRQDKINRAADIDKRVPRVTHPDVDQTVKSDYFKVDARVLRYRRARRRSSF
ncbi:hypothetical protein [Paraburkholderia sp. BCC1885]|uniref:hypothetical protein n=1 Tax=Paraburkholderia sp. BCC1885 TaxID=2562669 RepID=UPI0011843C6C|nr:hypothetical protein [Paraburkholderia sp. BCC1885]